MSIDPAEELLRDLVEAWRNFDDDEWSDAVAEVMLRIDEWSMSLPETAIPFTEDHVGVEEEVA